jgi:hypothetical protein
MSPATRGRAFQPASRFGVAAWAVAAAFGTYFCMYAFRKPFTAAAYADVWWGMELKTILVSAQVFGYMLSKFVGIRVVAELPPHRRAVGILVLILIAELALVLFGLVPAPWNAACLFLNGLPLGMVFGIVLGYLEGRRETEALAAGLCASFILAGGVMKSVGTWLLNAGVSEAWMPAAAGGLFLLPLLGFVALLSRVPPPTAADHVARAPRPPLDRAGRRALTARFLTGLTLVVIVFTLVTVLRSIRDDFAPELFRGLGEPASAGAFALADLCVALVVLAVSGCGVLVRDNRTAFLGSLVVCAAGCVLLAAAAVGVRAGWLGAFGFMVTCGMGLYIPYVVVHTTVFERLLATTRAPGNLGFLMYLADAFGYLGYVAVMLGRGWLGEGGDRPLADFFVTICLGGAVVSIVLLGWAGWYFAHKLPRPATTPSQPEPAHA